MIYAISEKPALLRKPSSPDLLQHSSYHTYNYHHLRFLTKPGGINVYCKIIDGLCRAHGFGILQNISAAAYFLVCNLRYHTPDAILRYRRKFTCAYRNSREHSMQKPMDINCNLAQSQVANQNIAFAFIKILEIRITKPIASRMQYSGVKRIPNSYVCFGRNVFSRWQEE